MDEIKTNYIKNKIKKLNFSIILDRKYIEDLMYIEKLLSIDASRWGFAGAMKLNFLKEEYKEEYWEIYKELTPDGYEKAKEGEKQKLKELDKLNKSLRNIEKRKTEKLKEEWLRVGGKL